MLVAATVAWLGYVVLQRVFTGRFWLWLLPDALPPVVFLVVPLLLLAARPLPRLVRRRVPVPAGRVVTVGAVGALVLGLGASGLNLHALLPADDAGPGSIRVVSWNTEYWHQDEDPARFYRFLTGQRADVYLLQEYLNWTRTAPEETAPRPVHDLDRLRREFPGYHIVARGELLTLSRFPIVGQPPVGPDRTVRAGAAFEEIYPAAKVLRTDLRVGDRRLSAYNVHIPVPFALARDRVLGQLRTRDAIRQRHFDGLRADLGANPHPVLVAGDFNTSPAMGDLRALRGELTDAVHASRSLYPTSWYAGSWLQLWRLDWAFTSAGVRVGRYEFVGPQTGSDHRAQRLQVDLVPGAPR